MKKPGASDEGPTVRSLVDRGLLDLAIQHATERAERAPRDLAALHDLAVAQREFRDFLAAQETLDRAQALAPTDAAVMASRAINLADLGDLEGSLRLARAAAALQPGAAWSDFHHASILLRQNRYEEAIEAFDRVPADFGEPGALGVQLGLTLVAAGRWERAEEVLRGVVDSPRAGAREKAYALFQIAKSREKQQDYDGAWEAATSAHRTLARPVTAERYRADAEAIRATMNRAALEGWASATAPFEQAVFIVGMPRSGTSLLEQILSMHPDVANGGEMSAAIAMQRMLPAITDSFLPWPRCLADMQERDADRLQDHYRRATASVGDGRRRVTDKSLLLVYQMGFLSRVLPGARSIMLRRNPLDTIVSCYTTHLACIGHSYTSDVRVLAEVWKIRDELQDFWMEHLDPAPLDLSYESLVTDQEAQSRRIVEHLDLPWDERCLRFHESDRVARTISFDQVNRKMYTSSVERWRRYEKHLGPAIDLLGL